MPSDRMQQAQAVFNEALRKTPAERQAYLETACGNDARLRADVESLLACD